MEENEVLGTGNSLESAGGAEGVEGAARCRLLVNNHSLQKGMIIDQGGYGNASGVEGADGSTYETRSESTTAYTVLQLRQRQLRQRKWRHKHTRL